MIEGIKAINSRIQEIQSSFSSLGMGSPIYNSSIKSFATYMQEAEAQLNKTSAISSGLVMPNEVNNVNSTSSTSMLNGVYSNSDNAINNIGEVQDYIISNINDNSLETSENVPIHSRALKTYRSMAENFPTTYDSIIEEAAQRYGVDKDLIKAVIKQESNYNTDAISRRGAVGLMQLMPSTADSMGIAIESLTDAKTNIFAGTRYLSEMLSKYNGRTDLALSAYNAGPGAVKDRVPNIAETKDYVTRILGYIE